MPKTEITPEQADQISQLSQDPTQLAESVWQSDNALFSTETPSPFFFTVKTKDDLMKLPDKLGQYGVSEDSPGALFFQVAVPVDKGESWKVVGISDL